MASDDLVMLWVVPLKSTKFAFGVNVPPLSIQLPEMVIVFVLTPASKMALEAIVKSLSTTIGSTSVTPAALFITMS